VARSRERLEIMPDYTVVRADHKEDWSGKFGPMSTYALELQEVGDGSGNSRQVEMNQKPATAPPQVGETLSGTITSSSNPDFADKFKKEFKEGGFSGGGGSRGGGTFKPRDPSEIAGARHAHNLLVAAHSFPPMPMDAQGLVSPRLIQARLDDLEAFACVLDEKTAAISDAAKAQPAAEKPKEDDSSLPF
jgi:hypothetical protein